MRKQSPADVIARQILAGFDEYRQQFQIITRGACARFERARWLATQQAASERIALYEQKVKATVEGLRHSHVDGLLLDARHWPEIKAAYIRLIEPRFDDELAETWYNSIFCSLFSHDLISDRCMFIHSTRPLHREQARSTQTRYYHPQTDVAGCLAQILHDYRFDLPFADLATDSQRLAGQLQDNLPAHMVQNPALCIELFSGVLYRNKGAYLVGRIYARNEQWPLMIALIHEEGRGIVADALITDKDEVSIIFSFTRSYFMVDVPVPADFVDFLKSILPDKHIAELYTSIGFYKQGKSEFYRALIAHLAASKEQFVMAPGVRGMVMSVFTLPGFNTVFKVIKDRFSPIKTIARHTVIEKYRLVKNIDRVGRMADTQEFSDFRFAKERFAPDCLAELLEVAPSTVVLEENGQVLIRHCWTERRMIPLNLYLEQASPAEQRAVLDDYGLAIKQLAAANIFPGDMLLKNFGVTRHGRVVFYDYDEICFLNEVNFRRIPPPRYPEEELAAEPWYSVAPEDVFPEEFPTFLFADAAQRRLFRELHGDLFEAGFWQSLQQAIHKGKIIDVFPYRRPRNGENG